MTARSNRDQEVPSRRIIGLIPFLRPFLRPIPAYVHESSELRGDHNLNIGEVSAEWRVTDKLTIGPGIMFGLDGAEETPHFGAGVTLHYEWN